MVLASHFVKHFLGMNGQNKRERSFLVIREIPTARFAACLLAFFVLKQEGVFQTQDVTKEV